MTLFRTDHARTGLLRAARPFAILVFAGCAPAAPQTTTPEGATATPAVIVPGEEETKIAAVLDDWHDAAANADEERYFGHLTEDSVFLGTDATERWDKKAFRAYAHPHFAKGKAWSFKAVRRAIVIAASGDSAWFDEDLETARLGPARGSGALVRSKEGWRIAQYNLSIPIPNEKFDAIRDMIAGKAPDASSPPAGDRCPNPPPAGTICGYVMFTGTPPVMKVPAKRKDAEFCKGIPVVHDAVVVNGGRLVGTAVRVVSGLKGAGQQPPATVVELHQTKCAYLPRIMGAVVGQTLRIHNDDATLHNAHGYDPTRGTWFNQAQPRGSSPIEKKLTEEGVVRLTSDIFPWMGAFVVVSSHGHWDVSDAKGEFAIKGLPAGTYGIEAWHPVYGASRGTVTLQEGKGAVATFTYTGTEPPPKENPSAADDLKSFR